MKPQSRADRIREWLKANGAICEKKGFLPREIAAGVQAMEQEQGLPVSRGLSINHSVDEMWKNGILERDHRTQYYRRYWLVREPAKPMELTDEERKARHAAMARARHLRNGGKSRAQLHQEAVARREARKAATRERLMKRDAEIRAKRDAELAERKKRAEERQRQLAAHDRARALVQRMKANKAAERQPRKPVPDREMPRPLQHVMPPAKPKIESSFEAEARGVKVQRLPPGASSTPLKHFPISKAA